MRVYTSFLYFPLSIGGLKPVTLPNALTSATHPAGEKSRELEHKRGELLCEGRAKGFPCIEQTRTLSPGHKQKLAPPVGDKGRECNGLNSKKDATLGPSLLLSWHTRGAGVWWGDRLAYLVTTKEHIETGHQGGLQEDQKRLLELYSTRRIACKAPFWAWHKL